MGTPGDRFPLGKVVHSAPPPEPLEAAAEQPGGLGPDMTVLQNVPSLGIFIEHDLEQQAISEHDKGLLLPTLEELEKQLLLDTASESDNSSSNVPLLVDFTPQSFFDQPSTSHKSTTSVPELSLPGPSGLQTPKTTKPSTNVKIAPKRNKKPPLSSQTPKKPHVCPVCAKSFQTSTKLASHQLVHSGGTPFKCEHCKKSFSSKFKLVRHVLIHSDRKPFSCTVCERTFHRKDHLKNHIKVHSPSKKVYACERASCKKEYTSVMSYRKHLALHAAEEGSLECKICSKLFETKADILYHLKIHAGSRTVKNPNEKKFTCDYCDRKFFTRKDVRRHLVVHTGTRNFLCQFCPQRFGRKDHLVRHIKKSHSKNFTELDTTPTETTQQPFDIPEQSAEEPTFVKTETKLEIPQIEVENILDYEDDKSSIKLEEIPEVQNLLFSRSFTELSPMLCAEPEFMSPGGSQESLPTATELLSELDAMERVPGALPTDIIDSDLLRLIGEGGDQLAEDENNLPLPGFSQVFKQQEPPPS